MKSELSFSKLTSVVENFTMSAAEHCLLAAQLACKEKLATPEKCKEYIIYSLASFYVTPTFSSHSQGVAKIKEEANRIKRELYLEDPFQFHSACASIDALAYWIKDCLESEDETKRRNPNFLRGKALLDEIRSYSKLEKENAIISML